MNYLFVSSDHISGGLNQLHQHSDSGLRVDEADIVSTGSLANSSRSEDNTLGSQLRHGGLQIIDPQADVVEGRDVNLGRLVWINRNHEVDFDGGSALANNKDILVHILFLRDITT